MMGSVFAWGVMGGVRQLQPARLSCHSCETPDHTEPKKTMIAPVMSHGSDAWPHAKPNHTVSACHNPMTPTSSQDASPLAFTLGRARTSNHVTALATMTEGTATNSRSMKLQPPRSKSNQLTSIQLGSTTAAMGSHL